jgi:hypothetical protein
MPELYGPGLWGPGLWGALDSPLNFDDLTTYYINLLIMQYVTKVNARRMTGVLVREATAESINAQVRDGFDLETAVGTQLDMLAEYRGIGRTVYGLDLTRDYFAMPYYTDATPENVSGFSIYGEDPTAYWILYADALRAIYAMTDDELRRMTKFLAKTQSRFLSVKEIDDTLWEFFGANLVLQDNEDMTIEYVHNPTDPDTLFTIASGMNLLPKPAGVSVSYT